jgi:hypothetical protein
MSEPEGNYSIVTETILSLIASADSSLQPQSTHVLPNWKTPVNYLAENYPVVTLRVGMENLAERIYGRQISSSQRGHFVVYKFSAHVWAEKTWQLFQDIDEEDETIPVVANASDLADKIISIFLKYTGDDISGIVLFDRITSRESEPERGPQRLTRIIIEGFVLVKRPLA